MSRLTRACVATGTAMLLAGGALVAASPAEAGGTPCGGMPAPARSSGGNTAPAPVNDTTTAIAGGVRIAKVLANDTDPDGDRLYVVSAASPRRGQVCVDSDGAIEYFAASSSVDYTDTFTYGVTDGDLYRTATVTVKVSGVMPLRATLLKKKRGHKKALVSFHNYNRTRNMVVLAGTPSKKKPLLTRLIPPGRSVGLKTKYKRIDFFGLVNDVDGVPILVDIGRLNTKSGAQSITVGDQGFLRTHPRVAARQKAWLRFAK